MLWCLGFTLKYSNNNKKYKTQLKQSKKKWQDRTEGREWKEKLFKTDAGYRRTCTSSPFLWVDFKFL